MANLIMCWLCLIANRNAKGKKLEKGEDFCGIYLVIFLALLLVQTICIFTI